MGADVLEEVMLAVFDGQRFALEHIVQSWEDCELLLLDDVGGAWHYRQQLVFVAFLGRRHHICSLCHNISTAQLPLKASAECPNPNSF
jgi:hypothetical protein